MKRDITVDGIRIELLQKNIKNIYLNIYPPDGRVCVSAPYMMNIEVIRAFVITKLAWIRKQRQRLIEPYQEVPQRFADKENHYLWGVCYQLRLKEHSFATRILLDQNYMILYSRPDTTEMEKALAFGHWYGKQLQVALLPLVVKWEAIMMVKVNKIFVQKMKTRWGSCNYRSQNIRFNTELAKRRPLLLEYVVVHELAHLLEPSHNSRFKAIMDKFMPQWRVLRSELNSLPLSHF